MGYKPIDLGRLQVTSLEDRPSKVRSADAGRTVAADASFRAWFDALPNILAGAELRELVRRTADAIEHRRPILLGMGGHVIKVGLGGMLCDLVRDGYVSAVVSNGSVTIHDSSSRSSARLPRTSTWRCKTGRSACRARRPSSF